MMVKMCIGFKTQEKVYCVKDAETVPVSEHTEAFKAYYAEDGDKVCSVCKRTLAQAAQEDG